MNEQSVTFTMYPEQLKSLQKLMTKSIQKGFYFKKKYNRTYENVMRLKLVIEENMKFLLSSLITKDGSDVLSAISEHKMFCEILLNEDFIWLLAKNSLTNRIITGCEKKELPIGVIYRIRECAIAFDYMTSNFDCF